LKDSALDFGAIASFKLNPGRLASLVALTEKGSISTKNARQTAEAVIAEDKDPELIIREKGWERLSDPALIAQAVEQVRAAEAEVFAELRSGAESEKRRRSLSAFLLGKVLAATGGRADPEIAGKQIAELIKG
jgi:aspartyl-tRNA(Asn)/glutamyl-tRNA(Gln) amidotransferase subunit B